MEATVETFQSQQHTIPVAVFQLADSKRPGIIFLHGANGLTFQPEPYFHFAKSLARAGYVIFLVHYFIGTETIVADRETMRKHFLQWGRTVQDALLFVASRPTVLPDRLGLLGVSLGATLALSVAALQPGIQAVVEFCGALPDQAIPLVRTMPPTLIIHGAKDLNVPVDEAYKLEKLLKEKGVAYEAKIYPHEGHVFGARSAADAAKRTTRFFHKHLMNADFRPSTPS